MRDIISKLRGYFARNDAKGKRAYTSGVTNRLTQSWASPTSSADAELYRTLTTMRNRHRELFRNYGFAKRAKSVIRDNVIGSGVGLQANVMIAGRLYDTVNDAIERGFEEWSRAENCHVAGRLHFADIERLAYGEIIEAGEVFIRIHRVALGSSRVPIALEIIEAERIAEEYERGLSTSESAHVRMGVEVDNYFRPIAYHIHTIHPGERSRHRNAVDVIERVNAADILHLYVPQRWPQTRGIPAMYAIAKRLWDVDGYTEAEIVAARAASTYMGLIKTDDMGVESSQSGEQQEMTLEAGMIRRLAPNEDFVAWSPNRPNSGAEPFLRYLLREMAAGLDISYESLSRDYSQTNYSSARQAMLEDRDFYRCSQAQWRRMFREPLHALWIEAAVLSGALPEVSQAAYIANPSRFRACSFKFRGWSWVDPTKEVEAFKAAVRAGFTTVSDVISATSGGQDFEEVMRRRKSELEVMKSMGIEVDTTVSEADGITGNQNNEKPSDQPSRNLEIVK